MRSSENDARSAPAFSISVRHASADPTSAIAAATERGSIARRAIALCVLRVADGDRIDQIGIEQQRRALQHDSGDLRLVVGQRMHHGGGRLALEASASASA